MKFQAITSNFLNYNTHTHTHTKNDDKTPKISRVLVIKAIYQTTAYKSN